MKKISQRNVSGTILLVALMMLGACANENETQETSKSNTSVGNTTFESREATVTRTSVAHTLGAVSNTVSWMTGDKIWVDNGGTLVASWKSHSTLTLLGK